MLKRLGFLFFLLTPCIVVANTNDDLQRYESMGNRQFSSIPTTTLDEMKSNSEKSQLENQTLVQKFIEQTQGFQRSQQKPKKAPNAILFVSFSMPKALLFKLSDEAAAFDIPVVINGLVDGDFKKTIEMFSNLNRDAQKDHLNFKGISIDPLWFQQFQITSVPALVLSQRPGNCETQTLCPNQTFDVVYGNASIKRSLELIRDKGDSAHSLARALLEQGHV